MKAVFHFSLTMMPSSSSADPEILSDESNFDKVFVTEIECDFAFLMQVML